MNDTIICIYHYLCADGFAAAWCVRRALGEHNVEFHRGQHGEPPPDVTGKRVVIVDFSYKADVIREMAKTAKSILILDHHKTAEADLAEFGKVAPGTATGWIPTEGVHVLFDMNRSGAGLTWDYFFDIPRPALIDHVEDRDLWRFALPGTKEIQTAVLSYPYTFEAWDNLILDRTIMSLYDEGVTLHRKHMKDIHELTAQSKRRATIGGHDVPVVNLPYTMASEACHLLCKDEPFAASYFDAADGRRFSLRSEEGGVDVSEIAQQYGGGGHEHAAGFTAPHGWLGGDE